MPSTTFFLWPKMKLLNQNRTIVRFEPKTKIPGGAAATDVQQQYDANAFACAPVAAAMAVRSVIEHSSSRFANLKTTAQLRPGTGGSITVATPGAIDDATIVDFYDVALMTFMANIMDYTGATAPPFKRPSVTIDGDMTTGLGLMAGVASQFKPAAGAVGSIRGTRVRSTIQLGITQNRRSYPRISSSQLIALLQQNNAVVLGFDFVRPRMKGSQFELDRNGNKKWVQTGVGHAFAVNGFANHAQVGDLFRMFDPFGIKKDAGVVDIGLSIFWDLANGMIEYVKLAPDNTETTLIEQLTNGQFSEIRSIAEDAGHGHPVWMFNPFDSRPVGPNFAGRILTSIATLKIGSGSESLQPHEIDDSDLIGQGKVDETTGLPVPGNVPVPLPKPVVGQGKGKSTPSTSSVPKAAVQSAQAIPRLPGKT